MLYCHLYQPRSQKLQLGGSFVQNSGFFNKYVAFLNEIVVKLWTFYLRGGFFRTYRTPLATGLYMSWSM